MMMNIFSIFDPSTSPSFSLNWLSSMIIFLFFPYQFWRVPSRFIVLWSKLMTFLNKEFKILLSYSFLNISLFLSMFMLIMMNNFMGLFPYIFTSTSHLSFTLSLSLSMWLGMMIFSWINFTNTMFSHLVPTGTPSVLMPFMVLIESISLIIRPITLAIRLSANMIAGHLLLSLLGSAESKSSLFMFQLLIISQLLLLILELSISFIQAYVFSILSTLYSSEI